MPIGKFARACRLSVKALRHYDEERLLRPARVDERTGYRYYTSARPAILRRTKLRFASVRVLAPMPELPRARIVDVPGGELAAVMHVGRTRNLGSLATRSAHGQTGLLLPL